MVVQRDLRTGAERPIDSGPGELSRAFFDRSGRFVVMDVVARDTDRDGLLTQPRVATTLGSRRCRAPVSSASFFGEMGDKPVQRIAPVEGGPVRDAPSGPSLTPDSRPKPGYNLVSRGPTATGRGDALRLARFTGRSANLQGSDSPTRRAHPTPGQVPYVQECASRRTRRRTRRAFPREPGVCRTPRRRDARPLKARNVVPFEALI